MINLPLLNPFFSFSSSFKVQTFHLIAVIKSRAFQNVHEILAYTKKLGKELLFFITPYKKAYMKLNDHNSTEKKMLTQDEIKLWDLFS